MKHVVLCLFVVGATACKEDDPPASPDAATTDDADPTDAPGQGRSGVTDADPSDMPGQGRGASNYSGQSVYSGHNDNDPTDPVGYGRRSSGIRVLDALVAANELICGHRIVDIRRRQNSEPDQTRTAIDADMRLSSASQACPCAMLCQHRDRRHCHWALQWLAADRGLRSSSRRSSCPS